MGDGQSKQGEAQSKQELAASAAEARAAASSGAQKQEEDEGGFFKRFTLPDLRPGFLRGSQEESGNSTSSFHSASGDGTGLKSFPSGLGPFSIRAIDAFVAGDVTARADTDMRQVQVSRGFFERESKHSEQLHKLMLWLDNAGCWEPAWTTGEGLALELHVSRADSLCLPPSVLDALAIEQDCVDIAGTYNDAKHRQTFDVTSDGSNVEFTYQGARKTGSIKGTRLDIKGWKSAQVLPDGNVQFRDGGFWTKVAGKAGTRDVMIIWLYPKSVDRPHDAGHADIGEDIELDTEDPVVSFFTVGGYMIFRSSASQDPKPSSDEPRQLDILKACTIRYKPAGLLTFSGKQPLDTELYNHYFSKQRFQPITVQKWFNAGARYFAWVPPADLKLESEYGGFAFLFHGLDEQVTEDDGYFEISSAQAPDLELGRFESLPFSLVAVPPGYKNLVNEKLYKLMSAGRLPLVTHLLAEYPELASSQVDGGKTLLHACAENNILDIGLLRFLKENGAAYDAKDASGHVATDLSRTNSFKGLVREVWGLSPDMFEEPDEWFTYWDTDGTGTLSADKLAEAIASAYWCEDAGTEWVKSYVNISHPAGARKADMFGPDGLLEKLQTSDDFTVLRHRNTPPLFNGRSAKLGVADREQLRRLQEQLSSLRSSNGWLPGKPAPSSAMELLLPAPCPLGSVDVKERMHNARNMLSFSMEQTRSMAGKDWLKGFRVSFNGQEGLDDGGLTKAWVSEIAFALWGECEKDNDLFSFHAGGCYFKPDGIKTLVIDGVPINSIDLYRWTGRFVAYAIYQECQMNCGLCAWVFRRLQPTEQQKRFFRFWGGPAWPETRAGEDMMLDDMASLDHLLANSLWRVRHEMSAEELQWLDFTFSGVELEPGGADRQVTENNKATYIQLACSVLLMQRSRQGSQAFVDGFFEVLPTRLFQIRLPRDALLHLLRGQVGLGDSEVTELERLIVPGGLLPTALRDKPKVREAAAWFFKAVRARDGAFRARLLEFWLGIDRIPMAGIASVKPRPKLQIMVQSDRGSAVKRILSWPSQRLPEGHTCDNMLWLALPNSYEELAQKLGQAVGNFEAGFALK